MLRPDRRSADVVVNNFRAGVMERMGFGYEELPKHQSAPHLRGRHRLRPDRPLRAQGRPGRAGAGDVRRDGARAPTPSLPLSVYSDDLRRLLGRHAPRAGRAARAAAAREDRARPAGQRVAAQLDARRADAGGGDAHDARARGELGRDAADRRVRDHRRRARDGRRVQGQSAARHRHARSICPALHDDPRFATHALQVAEQAGAARACSASASRPTRRRTGSPGWRSRTCCARRCARSARRWTTSRRAINGMILEDRRTAVETVRVVGSPVHLSRRRRSRVRIPPAELGAAHRRGAGRDSRGAPRTDKVA